MHTVQSIKINYEYSETINLNLNAANAVALALNPPPLAGVNFTSLTTRRAHGESEG